MYAKFRRKILLHLKCLAETKTVRKKLLLPSGHYRNFPVFPLSNVCVCTSSKELEVHWDVCSIPQWEEGFKRQGIFIMH